MKRKNNHPNALIHESSPYLLQHANNPVNWQPWGEKALKTAAESQKPLLVSIGYAACHWCHVMEHESFEDEEVARIMNQKFVCIKVDREELPDIDQLYMGAIHLMGKQGGWPLNVVTLPDGRPFWGGTYFQKSEWVDVLQQLSTLFVQRYADVVTYAERLSEGIKQAALVEYSPLDFDDLKAVLHTGVEHWQGYFDAEFGGNQQAPKFMMPGGLGFLLHYGRVYQHKRVLDHVYLTCLKMAQGGLYDQVGGGFSRYSVDAFWKVPHFEKMLYDNAQLVSLYCLAYQVYKAPEFKKVVTQTLDFVRRELRDNSGFFYASLDADSEGEEGRFYVWKKDELRLLLKDDYALFSAYYNVNRNGYWENGNYILLRTMTDEAFAEAYAIEVDELRKMVERWQTVLLEHREKRVRPMLDHKILTSWNAMMGSAFLDAYLVFNDEEYLQIALKNALNIEQYVLGESGDLMHSFTNGAPKIDGYLEDYAHVLRFFIRLFQFTGQDKWLHKAQTILRFVNLNFWDEEKEMFTFNHQEGAVFITHHYEVYDNVIPCSNGVMAQNLWIMGKICRNGNWMEQSLKMTRKQMNGFADQFNGLTLWGILAMLHLEPSYELVVTGPHAKKQLHEISQEYLPDVLPVLSTQKSIAEILQHRFSKHQTQFFVCTNRVCQMPVASWVEARKLMGK